MTMIEKDERVCVCVCVKTARIVKTRTFKKYFPCWESFEFYLNICNIPSITSQQQIKSKKAETMWIVWPIKRTSSFYLIWVALML